ncbi:MAG: Asp-tRNA(Asn)/Glu-tRNA(Gln) amidotransferase subunit GatC [Pseudomonadales bacterium]|jgi:aspartyl-tRNA(Asn)/glutamyl-tRNA(Gln) amidotransferase subunit C|nr:Asp-tRNA(Asn)/Glu-tRNA(Gln) amidotransferase subunit GatC [Pseudomonadales bacterium]
MHIDAAAMHRLAALARIALGDGESEQLTLELDAILALVDDIQSVDVEGVEPLAHPIEIAQRLREDVVTEPDQREAFQASAPAVEKGLYLVPRVVE